MARKSAAENLQQLGKGLTGCGCLLFLLGLFIIIPVLFGLILAGPGPGWRATLHFLGMP